MKKTGRPRLGDEAATVGASTKLSPRVYDALYHRAQAARVTVSEQIRRDVAAASKKGFSK